MNTKIYSNGMVSLGLLADSNLPVKLRVQLFYSMFGRPRTIWTTDEIGEVVGADSNSVKQARSRLAKVGRLEKVSFQIGGEWRYTWVAKAGDISLEGLKAINRKAGSEKVTYCTPGQQVVLMGRNYLAEGLVPNIFAWNVTCGGVESLWEMFKPYLLDWTDKDTWEFWRKFTNTLRAKNHPLREIRDEALRAQVAILCLELGAQKNRERSPDFLDRIEGPHGWLLAGLQRFVGREQGWGGSPRKMADELKPFFQKQVDDRLIASAEAALLKMEGKPAEPTLVAVNTMQKAANG